MELNIFKGGRVLVKGGGYLVAERTLLLIRELRLKGVQGRIVFDDVTGDCLFSEAEVRSEELSNIFSEVATSTGKEIRSKLQAGKRQEPIVRPEVDDHGAYLVEMRNRGFSEKDAECLLSVPAEEFRAALKFKEAVETEFRANPEKIIGYLNGRSPVTAREARKMGDADTRKIAKSQIIMPNIIEKRKQEISIGRAIRCLAEHRSIDGFEGEMIAEGQREARENGLRQQGIMLGSPAFISRAELRAMTATGGTSLNQGGMTVATNKAPLLASLFDSLFAVRAGATVYDGLNGNLDIPRIVDGADPAHKTENAQADEVSPTTAQLSLSPKRLPIVIEVSNQLLYQSAEAALDEELKAHIRQKLSVIMQRMMINGSGSSSEPEGILNTTGIGSVSLGAAGGAPTYAGLCDLIREVSIDNALDDTAAFAINSKTAAKLKQIQKVAATDSTTLIDDRAPGRLAGYGYYESNSIPSNLTEGSVSGLSAILFGSWRDLVLAQWSGIELLVNPYSKDDQGITRITAAIYYDCGLRRPQSFAAIKDAVTA